MMSPELFQEWGRRDPVGMYEEYLADLGRSQVPADGGAVDRATETADWNRLLMQRIEAKTLDEVDTAEQEALRSLETSIPQAGPSETLDCYG